MHRACSFYGSHYLNQQFRPLQAYPALAAFAALFALSQLYGVIPPIGHFADALSVPVGSAALVQSVFGIAYAAGFVLWGAWWWTGSAPGG